MTSMVFFLVAVFLIILGLIGLALKKDVYSLLLSLELSFLGVSLFFALIAKHLGLVDGFVMVLLILITMAIHLGIGLSLIIASQESGKFQIKEDLDFY